MASRCLHLDRPDDLERVTAEDSEAATEAPSPCSTTWRSWARNANAGCLLLGFYYCQQRLAQLANAHGYRSVRSATVQKFKCLERLRELVRTAFRAETIGQ